MERRRFLDLSSSCSPGRRNRIKISLNASTSAYWLFLFFSLGYELLWDGRESQTLEMSSIQWYLSKIKQHFVIYLYQYVVVLFCLYIFVLHIRLFIDLKNNKLHLDTLSCRLSATCSIALGHCPPPPHILHSWSEALIPILTRTYFHLLSCFNFRIRHGKSCWIDNL